MIYKAFLTDTQKFLALPETGMGYQVIEAKRSGETYKNKYVVYNGELVIDLDSRLFEFKEKIKIKGFSKVLSEAEMWLCETASISLVPKSLLLEKQVLDEKKKKYKKRYSDGNGAKENPKEFANGNEVFVRLSAYKNDRRIDFEKKRLIEGSYTTTRLDYLDCVNYFDDPVDRYALPNDDPIEWAFYIQPKTKDQLQRGIVQPAFGHDGGGIEAYFENGTSDNTYLATEPYGK
jgi:hypothetical protein